MNAFDHITVKADRPTVGRFRALAVAALASLALGFTAAPADVAAAATGSTGSITIARPNCNVGNGVRDLYAPLPTIYAANRTAGSGNDRQAVHYWVRAYDYATGRVLTNWVYGGGAWANDNSAASFGYVDTFAGQRYLTKYRLSGSVVRLQYSVAWYTPGGARIGTNDPLVTSYQLWAAGTNQRIGTSYAC